MLLSKENTSLFEHLYPWENILKSYTSYQSDTLSNEYVQGQAAKSLPPCEISDWPLRKASIS